MLDDSRDEGILKVMSLWWINIKKSRFAISFLKHYIFLYRLVEICNQTILNDGKYTIDKANEYYNHAMEGWNMNNNFVFLIVRKDDNQICGAIEVKSKEIDRSEIEYWASEDAHGIMSASLKIIVEQAKAAGYKSLFARILTTNEKSMNVVKNNGFANQGLSLNEEDGKDRFIWVKTI